MPALIYIFIFLYGIVIGSFLNVCILRIPAHENIVSERSHCTACGHILRWYDLFPVFSYIALRGRCRYCGAKISVQYPIIEALNGLLWVFTFRIMGFSLITMLACLVISSLLALSVIDWRTFEIPIGFNIAIFVCGTLKLLIVFIEYKTPAALLQYVIGFFAVSLVLLLLYVLTKGKGIGGGDIKLMAASGLFLGWRLSILSLILGCLFGSVIHIARMKISHEGRVLAMGPYLSAGIIISLWFGEPLLNLYLGLF